MTRNEYLRAAKDRALRYLDRGDNLEAVTSLLSELCRHPEFRDHPGHEIGDMLLTYDLLRQNTDLVRRYIEGYR
jgi:hypothetical protein